MTNVLQQEILRSLPIILRPLIRFLLRSGIGFRELSVACKTVFVSVASEDYGLRARPTNISRVAAMTGISRKEVRALRETGEVGPSIRAWTTKLNPPTVVLHFWHSDPFFSDEEHRPLPLPFSGPGASFSNLVRRYAGDIPPGAVRSELKRSRAIIERSDGLLIAVRRHYTQLELDPAFVRSMAFSMANLGNTLVHNAAEPPNVSNTSDEDAGRLERYVWSNRLSAKTVADFKKIAETRADGLLAELDSWIGAHEETGASPSVDDASSQQVCGMGIYYFEIP